MDDGRTVPPDHDTTEARFKRRLLTAPSTEGAALANAWLAQNSKAIDEFNEWDRQHGSPLDKYRGF